MFNAQIEEVGGAFVGNIQEPNFFAPDQPDVLIADIEGVRGGASVSFTKFYLNKGMRHAVRYEGDVDDRLTRIEGAWSIQGDWSGTFFMTRDDDGEAAEAEEHAEVEVEQRQ